MRWKEERKKEIKSFSARILLLQVLNNQKLLIHGSMMMFFSAGRAFFDSDKPPRPVEKSGRKS